jgi:hypothetical protein
MDDDRAPVPPERPSPAVDSDDRAHRRPRGHHQALVWVGIAAGVLFIVVAIFFSGYVAGRPSGNWPGEQRGGPIGSYGWMYTCPMMLPGAGMMRPEDMMPGGRMNPGQLSPTTGPPMPPFTQRPS